MVGLYDNIYALNSMIVSVRNGIAYDKNENIIEYDIEIAKSKLIELQTKEAQIEQEIQKAKESAIIKLTKLGLNENEIKALIK